MQQTPYSAPDFSLPDNTESLHSLSEYAHKWLVLYFYPKDDTPGCTIEACSLRDARDDLMALDANVVGISKDTPSDHDKFKAKHNLNFTLLSDINGKTIEAYGAWGKKMYGREGILRKTFLIDPNGIVQKVYGKVTPDGHGEAIIADITKLKTKLGS